MISHTTAQALGQIRLDEMHQQARRSALAKTARRERRAQRQRARHRTRALLGGGLTRRARRAAPAPENV